MSLAKLKQFISDERNKLGKKRKEHNPDQKSEMLVDTLTLVSRIYDDGSKSSSALEDSAADENIEILETENTPTITPSITRRRSINRVNQDTPIIKKRRSSVSKAQRRLYLGIDNKKMWDFVFMKMRQEKKSISVGKKFGFVRKPAMGLALWKEYYKKYGKFDGEYVNMHSPESLTDRFRRHLFPNMAHCHLDWQNKVDYLLYSKYQSTEEFLKGLGEENDKMVIHVDQGVVIGVEPTVAAKAAALSQPEALETQESDSSNVQETPFTQNDKEKPKDPNNN